MNLYCNKNSLRTILEPSFKMFNSKAIFLYIYIFRMLLDLEINILINFKLLNSEIYLI